MLRLVLGDLIENLRIWVGAALVATVAAVVGAVVACDIQTALAVGGTAGLALYGISGTVILFAAVSTVVVLGSVTNLAVALHQRSYALWQLVGLGPDQVRTVVQVQIALMALLGAAAGSVIAIPLLRPMFAFCFADVPQLRDLTPVYSPAAAMAVIAYVLLTVLVGGTRGARRAGRTPAVQALRDPELPSRGMSAARWITSSALVLVLFSVIIGLPGKDPDEAATPLMLIGPLSAAVLSALSPVFMAPLLRAWTAVVPASLSSWWHVARQATVHRATQSAAVINPLVLAMSLAGGLYASQSTASSGDTLSAGGVVLLLGGPVALSLTGATVTLFMAGRQRNHEVALLLVGGGTPTTVVAAAVAEAVMYAVTATILAVPTVIATGLAGAWALHVPPSFGLGAVAVVAMAGLVLILCAVVLSAHLALRRNVVRTLAAE
ncbi:FtsX-like permease family protein [Streptomyces sp. NRRL S-31]|uniref:FtsX-like permease family protein n=1 Tax=Streptomyces sp. NRRL S-31 TaxID=1463898 RepID=UPI0004C99D26|nr:FtsX-like permease family protein [Streptomyces sp. NRRL S-31]